MCVVRVGAQPPLQARLIIAGPIVVEPGLGIKLLARELIGQQRGGAAILYPGLPEREVLDVLKHPRERIRDDIGGAEMISVVEEELELVRRRPLNRGAAVPAIRRRSDRGWPRRPVSIQMLQDPQLLTVVRLLLVRRTVKK